MKLKLEWMKLFLVVGFIAIPSAFAVVGQTSSQSRHSSHDDLINLMRSQPEYKARLRALIEQQRTHSNGTVGRVSPEKDVYYLEALARRLKIDLSALQSEFMQAHPIATQDPEPDSASGAPTDLADDATIIQSFGYGSNSIAKITDTLFLSSIGPAENLKLLEALKITHILNLTGVDKRTGTFRFPSKFPSKFQYKHIVIEDENSSEMLHEFKKKFFMTGFEFIKSAQNNSSQSNSSGGRSVRGGRTLVHCEAGISRSSTMVIAYLMADLRLTLKDAYEWVRNLKPNIGPNNAFFLQLIEFERQMRDPRYIDIGSGPDSMSLEGYLAEQMLAGPAAGFDLDTVMAALQRANLDPMRAMEYLFGEGGS
jgi:hypothetical protein